MRSLGMKHHVLADAAVQRVIASHGIPRASSKRAGRLGLPKVDLADRPSAQISSTLERRLRQLGRKGAYCGPPVELHE
jgi:hypothetical protein